MTRHLENGLSFICGAILLVFCPGASAVEKSGAPVPFDAEIRQLAKSLLERNLEDYRCIRDSAHPEESCHFEPGGHFSQCIKSGGDIAHKFAPGIPIADYWKVECLLKKDGLPLTSLQGRFGRMNDNPPPLDQFVVDRYVKPVAGYDQINVAFHEFAAQNKTYNIDLEVTVSSRRFIYRELKGHEASNSSELLTRGANDFTIQSITLLKVRSF